MRFGDDYNFLISGSWRKKSRSKLAKVVLSISENAEVRLHPIPLPEEREKRSTISWFIVPIDATGRERGINTTPLRGLRTQILSLQNSSWPNYQSSGGGFLVVVTV
jgi:hypothetical protein